MTVVATSSADKTKSGQATVVVNPPAPATALTISSVAVTPSSTSAVVTWTTNTASNSRVDYGTSASSLAANATNATMVTSHSITLSGLTAGTTYYFRVTSVDANANSATSPASGSAPATFATTSNSPTGTPISFWSNTVTPKTTADADTASIELGLKFYSDVTGYVTGVRFYKSTSNTGTHVGHLWSATGTLLATVKFTNETASGWQQATFSTPVKIAAGTTYVISYFAPYGRYADDQYYFTSTTVNVPPLHIPGGPSGVYVYGSTPSFPTKTWNNSNYWVDVVFVPGS